MTKAYSRVFADAFIEDYEAIAQRAVLGIKYEISSFNHTQKLIQQIVDNPYIMPIVNVSRGNEFRRYVIDRYYSIWYQVDEKNFEIHFVRLLSNRTDFMRILFHDKIN